MTPRSARLFLKQAVDGSFNSSTVDGDTSTNDMALLLAQPAQADGGMVPGTPEGEAFAEALRQVCDRLAEAIVLDGEGATKLVEIIVRGAANQIEAEVAAKTIATSPLMKTALIAFLLPPLLPVWAPGVTRAQGRGGPAWRGFWDVRPHRRG